MKANRIAMVSIEKLVLDYQFYPRTMVDGVHVRHIIQALEAGDKLPPIRVDSKSLRIVDGFHRYRAHLKLERTEIECSLVDYPDEKSLYEEAISANSTHGKNYTPFDQGRIIQRAIELGLEPQRIAISLHVTPLRLEEIQRGFGFVSHKEKGKPTSKEGIPLKSTIAHLAGEELSPAQVEANNKLSGMKQSFYVNQLIILFESGLINLADQNLAQRLEMLHVLLIEFLKKNQAA